MHLAQGPSRVEEDLNQIKDLISAGEIYAFKSLQDYGQAFGGRDGKNDATALMARLHEHRQQTRKYGSNENSRREFNEIIASALQLADKIHDEFVARLNPGGPNPPGASRTLVLVPPAGAPVETEVEVAQSSDTHSRRNWDHAKREILTKFNPLADQSSAVFRCRGLSKRFGSTGFRLSNVDLDLVPGQITGLVGVNGSGKTTLLQMIAGVVSVSTGDFDYPAICGGKKDGARIRNAIGYVPQQPPRWYGRLADNLHLVAAAHGVRGRDNQSEVEFLLHRLELAEYRQALWSELSGGYRMRFDLARALVGRPTLLVLDEPLAPLDIVTQQLFLQDLRDIASSASRPLPIILSSQHLYEVESIADQMLFLDDGKPLFVGRPAEVARDSDENLFELSCGSSQATVERVLATLKGVAVTSFGRVLVVRVQKSVSGADVLQSLLNRMAGEVRFRRSIGHVEGFQRLGPCRARQREGVRKRHYLPHRS